MRINRSWLHAASGNHRIDLLLRDARLVNVFTGTIQRCDIGVHEGRIVGPGSYRAKRILNLEGRYLAPGFIDGHCHLESSMLLPRQYAAAVIPHGTTGVVADPHEIANVLGLEGIRYMVEESKGVPFRFHFTLPSCVPASPFETAGSSVLPADLSLMKNEPWALGLGEVMNFPGVIDGVPEVLDKLSRFEGGVIDGHAPGVKGTALNAYMAAGIGSDHECTTLKEAQEKLSRGMWIMIRQGSTARNLDDLLPLVNERTVKRCMLVTDDRTPGDLLGEGHLDAVIARAVEWGVDPILAIQMVTLNPAGYFRMRDLGAIAPGFLADCVMMSKLKPPRVDMVLVGGRIVYQNGKLRGDSQRRTRHQPPSAFHMAPISVESIRIPDRGRKIRVIELNPGQIFTTSRCMRPRVLDGYVISDSDRDVLKIAVIERHRGTGRVGLGFVRGFSLMDGALASSVAHDSHNVIAVGCEDRDLLDAIRAVARMRGGLVVVRGGRVVERLPLPVAGLMSPWSARRVAERHAKVREAAKSLGCSLKDPFMTLSFLALAVIPELKITDRGLVDVKAYRVVDLFA